MAEIAESPPIRPRFRIVVATTVLLSFISFWRAAAIVLNDLGSSAFYAAGIAEFAYGRSAPWFVLAVMMFANAVRMVYIESCAMFTRGGVYRVVKEAMGGTMGKLAVSALMFDYILTGPISSVSAGHYLVGLLNDSLGYAGITQRVPGNFGAMIFALLVTGYFWNKNRIGLHESSEKALRIMYIVTVLVVLVLAWGGITLLLRGGIMPPFPSLENLKFAPHALGWLAGTGLPQIGAIAALIAFGHSVLAMSGEESLAQVNREIEHPKLKNLKRAGVVIGVYTFLFTVLSAFIAGAIIPDAARPAYKDNLISGIAMNVVGPHMVRLLFQAFVVVVGTLMLAGAVNTAMIGSNGVLNRLAEDGVLTDWFRRPHSRFGTTYRMINMVAVLQFVTIFASRGSTDLLGEAYAFGVIWSFTLMTTSILVLRFKDTRPREWRVPLNPKIGGIEIPVGVGLVGLVLLATAITNLFTKELATITGIMFTAVMFVVFNVSERATRRRRAEMAQGMEMFNLAEDEQVSCDLVGCRPGCVLVAVRDMNSLGHLTYVLERTDTDEQDIVVMTTRMLQGPDFAERLEGDQNIFSSYEQQLFTRVVSLAEKMGKPVALTVAPGTDPFEAIVLTAQRLQAAKIVAGRSEKMSVQEQGRLTGLAWEKLPHPRPRFTLEIIDTNGQTWTFAMGPHAPALRPEDIEFLHRLWLELTGDPALRGLHHDHVISVALRRFAAGLRGSERDTIIAELRRLAAHDPRHHHEPRR